MNLSIRSIADRGNLAKERIVLKVLNDCDLSAYLVGTTEYAEKDLILARARNAYWFGPKEVSSGDLVVLYTKVGADSTRANDDGTTVHFFYRELATAQFPSQKSCAVLFELANWDTSKRGGA